MVVHFNANMAARLPLKHRPTPQQPKHTESVRFQGLTFATKLKSTIPVLDLQEFRDARTPSAKRKYAHKFGEAFRKYGFIAIKNHGIPKKLMDSHFKSFNTLMKRPEKELTKYSLQKLDLGYIPLEIKPDDKGNYTAVDPKQMWQTRSRAAVYPADAQRFATYNKKLFHDLRNVGYEVTEVLSLYLGGQKGQMLRDFAALETQRANKIPDDASMMRTIRYMKLRKNQRANHRVIQHKGQEHVVRTGEHRDMCLFTLLPQATDSGLQLFTKEREIPKGSPGYKEALKDDKNWLNVHAQEGYLILNAGDMLDFMTQDVKGKHLMATTHRVVAHNKNLRKDRFAMPFFFHGDNTKPLRNLKNGSVITRPEPPYNGVPFNTTLQMTYSRLKRAGIVPAKTTYKQFEHGFKNYPAQAKRVLKAADLETAFHAGIPIGAY